jgi:hypothetical protein
MSRATLEGADTTRTALPATDSPTCRMVLSRVLSSMLSATLLALRANVPRTLTPCSARGNISSSATGICKNVCPRLFRSADCDPGGGSDTARYRNDEPRSVVCGVDGVSDCPK